MIDLRVAALVCLLLTPLALAQTEGEPVRKEDLVFRQKRTLQQMEELEDRMFQLAEKIRAETPDHSARLLLALQRSREELIVDEMNEVSKLIEKGSLVEADEQQRKVIFRLKELRELILSTELDLLLKLKRLRQLNDSLRVLEDLRQESTALLKRRAPQAEEERTAFFRNTQRLQSDLMSRLELLDPKLREAAPETVAPDRLDDSVKALKAANSLLAQSTEEGLETQWQAADTGLRVAHQGVLGAREELLLELQRYIRSAMVDAFLQIIEVQGRVNRQVEEFMERERSGEGRLVSARDFGEWEDRAIEIGDRLKNAGQLMEETEYSLALAPVARFFAEYADEIRGNMRSKRLAGDVLATGQRLVEDLEGAVTILAEEAKWAKRAPPGDIEAFKQIKLLTELNVLRMVQERVRTDTVRLSTLPLSDESVQRNVARAMHWEASISAVTLLLEARGYSKYLKPEDEADF